MEAVVVTFAATLLVAVLLSGVAARTVLSTAVLFLGVGAAVGACGGLPMLRDLHGDVLRTVAEVALFVVLYTEGMQLDVRAVRESLRLPARTLLVGMPLTAALAAGAARLCLGVGWSSAFLLGAILSPTDPVFAAALVQRPAVPLRLRRMLNIGSGVNDGLALPFVMLLLPPSIAESSSALPALGQLAGGVALGVGLAWLAAAAVRLAKVRPSQRYRPLFGVAVGLLVFGLVHLVGGNEFLAAFAAGVTLATTAPEMQSDVQGLQDALAETTKLVGVLVLGVLVSAMPVAGLPAGVWIFTLLMLVAVRPVAIVASLAGTRLSWTERLVAGWFGPRGFASIFYGLLAVSRDAPDATRLFHVIAMVVLASIVAHSSTDVLVVRVFRRRAQGAGAHPAPAAGR